MKKREPYCDSCESVSTNSVVIFLHHRTVTIIKITCDNINIYK